MGQYSLGSKATTFSDTQIELQWDYDPEAVGYRLWATLANDSAAPRRYFAAQGLVVPEHRSVAGDVRCVTWDQGLQPQTTYYYWIQAVYDDGSASPDPGQSAASATTTAAPAVPRTLALNVTAVHKRLLDPTTQTLEEGVEISWTGTREATGYQVDRWNPLDSTWSTVPADAVFVADDPSDPAPTLRWFDDTARFSATVTSFRYRVVTWDYSNVEPSRDAGTAWPEVTVMRDTTGPSTPTGVKAVDYPQAVQVTWGDRPPVDDEQFGGWIVERCIGNEAPLSTTLWTRLTPTPITDLAGFNDYHASATIPNYYRVFAVDWATAVP